MRNEVLAANFALVMKGMPTLDELDERFAEGASSAQAAYALAYRAVEDLAALDQDRGLTRLFAHWRETRSLDRAVRAAFGITLATFEHDWQQRTRRRYGALALFSDLAIAGLLMVLIVTPLYLARRRRQRQRMAALVAAEAAAAQAERMEQERILDALLGREPASRDDGAPRSGASGERGSTAGPPVPDAEEPERGS
jgi:hypothetical protein